MGSLFFTALLALFGIGILVHGQNQAVCKTRQSALTRQQLTIQQLVLRHQYQLKWLQTFCQLDVAPLPVLPPPSPCSQWQGIGVPPYYPPIAGAQLPSVVIPCLKQEAS